MKVKGKRALLTVLVCMLTICRTMAAPPDDRQFDSEQVHSLQQELDMPYDTDASTSSFWEKVSSWLGNVVKSVLDYLADNLNIHIDPQLFKLIIYGLLLAALVYLIIKIAGAEASFTLFRKKKKIETPVFSIDEEQIDQLDFQKLIQEATEERNHTLVIRYYYLWALQYLAEKGAIEYHIRKTNASYLHELKDTPFVDAFTQMASLFEYIWYGNYTAAPEHCDRMAEQLKTVREGLA